MPQIKPISIASETFEIKREILWQKAFLFLGIERYKRKIKQNRKKKPISPL